MASQACRWKGNGKASRYEKKIPQPLVLLLIFQGHRKQRQVDSEDAWNLSHREEAWCCPRMDHMMPMEVVKCWTTKLQGIPTAGREPVGEFPGSLVLQELRGSGAEVMLGQLSKDWRES